MPAAPSAPRPLLALALLTLADGWSCDPDGPFREWIRVQQIAAKRFSFGRDQSGNFAFEFHAEFAQLDGEERGVRITNLTRENLISDDEERRGGHVYERTPAIARWRQPQNDIAPKVLTD